MLLSSTEHECKAQERLSKGQGLWKVLTTLINHKHQLYIACCNANHWPYDWINMWRQVDLCMNEYLTTIIIVIFIITGYCYY